MNKVLVSILGVLSLTAGASSGTPPSAAAGVVFRAGIADGVTDEEIEAVRAEARDDLLAGLEEHAAWCKTAKLYLERDKAYRRILALDSDHDTARRGLGYRRERDGSWREPSKTHKESKNYTPAKVPKAQRQLAETLGLYTERLYRFLDEQGEELTEAQRDRLLGEILKGDPDDERARALMGEVRSEDAWVLAETAASKARRKEMATMVRELVGAVPPPKRSEATAREKKIGIDWTMILEIPGVRVASTVEESEAKMAGQAVSVSQSYFNQLFGTKASLGKLCTLYLLDGPEDSTTLIDNHPTLAPPDREFLYQLVGGGFPGSDDLGHWGKSGVRRVDGIVRIALSRLFADAFNITTENAWASEGFGLYFTYQVLRSRLTWFVQPSKYRQPEEEKQLRGRLLNPDTNWMQEAHELLRGEQCPSLKELLTKNVNTLTTEELLYSYVLAAYLLEAQPESAAVVLKDVGGGLDPALALTRNLGFDLAALDARILRWLSERR